MKISNVLLLVERTLGSLKSVTSANFGAGREQRSNKVQLSNIKYIPAAQQGILRITCETSSDISANKYNTVIELHDVEFIDDSRYNFLKKAETRDSQKYNAFEFNSGGTQFFASYDRVKGVDVKVSCTCEDFRWRFANYNFKDNSLFGDAPQAYVKKTNRPPVNPNKTPGVCKHLLRLKKELESEEFFRELLN